MSLRVSLQEGRRGLRRFIDVPFRIRDGRRASPWVPPLRLVVADLLDDRKNPFYGDADRALFVAEDGGRTLGRVAAIENRWHNRHHGDRVGFFGFFDCVDDPDTAAELMRAAEGWLRQRGLEVSRGPMNPSMNHECGLLVEGFDEHPMVMTPWNPPSHAALLEGAGYRKSQDLLAYYITEGAESDERARKIQTLGERMRARSGLTFRDVDYGNLKSEARGILDLYNDAWSDNWGFVPPGWEEFWHTAHGLEAILAKDFSFIAEADGEPVGFMLIAHDLNHVLRKVPSGRLWPWNVARLLWGVPRTKTGRVMLLGIREAWRRKGIFPVLAAEMVRRGREVSGEGVEASWILEDNEALRAPLEALGFRPYRRWRIYDRGLGASDSA